MSAYLNILNCINAVSSAVRIYIYCKQLLSPSVKLQKSPTFTNAKYNKVLLINANTYIAHSVGIINMYI